MLDLLRGALRSALGVAERETVAHTPLRETEELNDKLREAIGALHRAADSLERHVEVVESLATSLAPLTTSVTRLTDQIGQLLAVTAPMAAAEREVSRVEHFFGRRGRREQPSGEDPQG